MKRNYSRTKAACYTSSLTVMTMANMPPLLFVTFRALYGLSYTRLGLLVLVNFLTQLSADLLFSFAPRRFPLKKTLVFMPLLAMIGLLVYALSPVMFGEQIFAGFVVGTVIFSFANGLGEVLLSPVVAAISQGDRDKEMSKFHSVYAWGVVGLVAVSTLFLTTAGAKHWQLLIAAYGLIQLIPAALFFFSPIPSVQETEQKDKGTPLVRQRAFWLCMLSIFFGGAAECTMGQWSSGYLEIAFGIPKAVGDIFGVALFACMLGLGRVLYARFGKNIEKVLFFSGFGALLCYAVAFFSHAPAVGLAACALTGLCTSMLWPGSLVVAADRVPLGGVMMYAMMAAGGDLGASLGPQLVGIVSDAGGIRRGLLAGMFFPLMAAVINYLLWKSKKTNIQ